MAAESESLVDCVEAVVRAGEAGKLTADAVANIRRWLTKPAYAPYRPGICDLVRQQNFERLEKLFWQQIPFGTGGRRGPMAEFGSATINERTIAESAHGLAVYLQQARSAGDVTTQGGGSAIVACDTRNRSAEFAELAATTLAANGLKVYLFDSFRSTPELSFAVRHLRCDVGVMISASHNPPADNGIKVYWSTGGQVLSPHDKRIIRCVEEADEIPQIDIQQAIHAGRIEIVGEEVDRAYADCVLAMSLSRERELPALYSPLHGVGETCCWQVLQRAGFRGPAIFEPHREPNGDFPNVPQQLPNPEREEVFEPMKAQAAQMNADVLIASDPDADRMAVCARDAAGDYIHLSGNEIGSLLVDYVLRKRSDRGDLTKEHYVVETLVTTRLIGAIARAHGVRVIDDLLVGFKYIAEVMDREGPEGFVFGAEESLGYLAGTYARDKDAGLATLYLAECAAEQRRAGKSLLQRLDELWIEHGCYRESQIARTCEGPEGSRQFEQIMRAFRESPPSAVAGIRFDHVADYHTHEIRSLPDNRRAKPLPSPEGDLMIFETVDRDPSVRVAVRPSGTEPKIKFYLFAHRACPNAAALTRVKEESKSLIGQIADDLNGWIDRHASRA